MIGYSYLPMNICTQVVLLLHCVPFLKVKTVCEQQAHYMMMHFLMCAKLVPIHCAQGPIQFTRSNKWFQVCSDSWLNMFEILWNLTKLWEKSEIWLIECQVFCESELLTGNCSTYSSEINLGAPNPYMMMHFLMCAKLVPIHCTQGHPPAASLDRPSAHQRQSFSRIRCTAIDCHIHLYTYIRIYIYIYIYLPATAIAVTVIRLLNTFLYETRYNKWTQKYRDISFLTKFYLVFLFWWYSSFSHHRMWFNLQKYLSSWVLIQLLNICFNREPHWLCRRFTVVFFWTASR